MNHKLHPLLPLAILSLVIGLSNAMAQNPSPPAPPVPSKETREKIATAHEHMAACLRTDKPIAECHAQMMKSVGHVPGGTGCPMMSPGMHGQMMQDQSAPARTVPPDAQKQ